MYKRTRTKCKVKYKYLKILLISSYIFLHMHHERSQLIVFTEWTMSYLSFCTEDNGPTAFLSAQTAEQIQITVVS